MTDPIRDLPVAASTLAACRAETRLMLLGGGATSANSADNTLDRLVHAVRAESAAELAAVRAERDCLAMAVLFAQQWKPDAPMGLREGIDEILATMPNGGTGETA